MNWRRGLFRIWLVVSASWIAGIGLVAYRDWPQPTQGAADYSEVEIYAAVALGVPLFFFLVGLSTIWAVLGFNRD